MTRSRLPALGSRLALTLASISVIAVVGVAAALANFRDHRGAPPDEHDTARLADARHHASPPSILSMPGLVDATGASRPTADGSRPSPQRGDGANVPYDGRFTFVRIRFEPLGGGDGWGRRDLKWDHDYPRGERNFTRIMHELTAVRTRLHESNVLTLDDPELAKYPVAYLCEPGFWAPTDEEAAGLRTYLRKGGFIIIDDFAGSHWYNFVEAMRKVLPDARLVPLDATHPIFDSFFHIESLDFDHPNYPVKAQFLGIFEDNDPSKRLMAIVNYNNDIGDYWEWSDGGWLPIELSNQAYRLGVNYVVYAMTR